MEKDPLSHLESLGITSTFDTSKGEVERRKYAEAYFGTSSDPDQIPITKESLEKLNMLTKHGLNCAYEGEKPISWTVSIPTSQALMDAFIKKEITEKEMFDRTKVGDYDALYISAAFTLPEYRGRGIAKALLTDQVRVFIEQNPRMELFTWIWSEEGERLIRSLPVEIAERVKYRK